MSTLPVVPEIAEFPLRSENRPNYVELFEAFGSSMPPFRAGMLEWGNYVIALASSGGFGDVFLGDDAGTANDYIFAPADAVTEHKLGRIYSFFAANDSSGNSNLTISNLPALAIKNPDGTLAVDITTDGLTKVLDMVTHYVFLKSETSGGSGVVATLLDEDGNGVNQLVTTAGIKPQHGAMYNVFVANDNTGAVTIDGLPLSQKKDLDVAVTAGMLSADDEHRIMAVGSPLERFWLMTRSSFAKIHISTNQVNFTSQVWKKIAFDVIDTPMVGMTLSAGDLTLPVGRWWLILKHQSPDGDYPKFRILIDSNPQEYFPLEDGDTNEAFGYDLPYYRVAMPIQITSTSQVVSIELNSSYGGAAGVLAGSTVEIIRRKG